MNFENVRDNVIVSGLFLFLASEWFDGWLRDMFPQLRSSSPIVVTIIKTGLFGSFYWLYKYLLAHPLNLTGNDSKKPPAPAGGTATGTGTTSG